MVARTHAVGRGHGSIAAQVTEAERLAKRLTQILESLGSREGALSENVAWTLQRTARELDYGYGSQGGMTFKTALERATDELNMCAPTRVDTDALAVPHGVVVLFRCFDPLAKRQVAEEDKLIARFLRAHPKVQIAAHDAPGGARDAFGITGEKQHRLAFMRDPHWPKLQRALTDIYMAEHLPGVASERPKREIRDTMTFVFGA